MLFGSIRHVLWHLIMKETHRTSQILNSMDSKRLARQRRIYNVFMQHVCILWIYVPEQRQQTQQITRERAIVRVHINLWNLLALIN